MCVCVCVCVYVCVCVCVCVYVCVCVWGGGAKNGPNLPVSAHQTNIVKFSENTVA